MYMDEADFLMKKLKSIEEFYASTLRNVKEKEELVLELIKMANNIEEETKNAEHELLIHNRKVNEDANEMKEIAINKIKELDEKEENLEKCRRLHEIEIKAYDEAAYAKREMIEKENKELHRAIADREVAYEKEGRKMTTNKDIIKELTDVLMKKKAKVAEIKRKKSIKRRLRSLFCCCFKI